MLSQESEQQLRAAAVDKAIVDNFVAKGWDREACYIVKRNKKTIADYITQAKVKQQRGEGTMGKSFYSDLRELFKGMSPSHEIQVDDVTEVKDVRIAAALKESTKGNPNYKLFLDVFEENYVPDGQRSIKAMFSSWIEVPSRTQVGSGFLCSALGYIVRNSLHTKYADVFRHLVDKFDQALEHDWLKVKGSGLSTQFWFRKHSSVLPFVVAFDAFEKLAPLKKGDINNSHEGVLVEACASCCGDRIWGDDFRRCSSSACIKIIKECIEETRDETLGSKEIAEAMGNAKAQITALQLNFDAKFPEPLFAEFEYRRLVLKPEEGVLSWRAYFVLAMTAEWRTRYVDSEVLKPLWCENDLVPEPAGLTCANLCGDTTLISKAALLRDGLG